jgi:hypothetical protein
VVRRSRGRRVGPDHRDAIRQPFSYDEIIQITPYGSNSVVEIVSATRQPPLDPLLGAMFQRLLGMGQLQQRLARSGSSCWPPLP